MNPSIVVHTTASARTAAGPSWQWLWPGHLATGAISLLTSRWKTGKTTLLSHLLRARETGGDLAGATVAPGRTVVVTEEPLGLWLGRADGLGFGANVHWVSRPFPVRPRLAEWENLILEVAVPDADLIVFDPLAMVLPADSEGNAGTMLTALEPLRLLTNAGKAVLILHHPRKQSPADDPSPRGSGALAGFADILLDLRVPSGLRAVDRVRRFRSASRLYGSTDVLLELSADVREYRVLPEPPAAGYDVCWQQLHSVFADATRPLTRQQVREYWPPDFDVPPLTTLTRWLERAVKEQRLVRRGQGTYLKPYTYALPEYQPSHLEPSSLDHMMSLRDASRILRNSVRPNGAARPAPPARRP